MGWGGRSPARAASLGTSHEGSALPCPAQRATPSPLPPPPLCTGWESPLSQQVYAIRQAEVRPLRRMATIRALNMALSYAIAPLVSMQQTLGKDAFSLFDNVNVRLWCRRCHS